MKRKHNYIRVFGTGNETKGCDKGVVYLADADHAGDYTNQPALVVSVGTLYPQTKINRAEVKQLVEFMQKFLDETGPAAESEPLGSDW